MTAFTQDSSPVCRQDSSFTSTEYVTPDVSADREELEERDVFPGEPPLMLEVRVEVCRDL